MPMLPLHNETEAGAVTGGGRRPTVVAAPASVSSELSNRPSRRTFTAADKLRILAATDRALETGGVGAVLRREGVYSSTLCDWRRQRDAGTLGALTPARRGPKALEANPLTAKVALLEKNNAHLTRNLARAEAIIAVQKKLMWTAPEVASPAHFAEAHILVRTWGTGQNEPSTACKPASRLVAEVKPRSREAGRRRRPA
jgi:transposase